MIKNQRQAFLNLVVIEGWYCLQAQGKLTSADTAYASEKPVCAVDLTLPGCLDLTCSMSRRLAVFDKKEEARLTEEPVNVASTDPARGDCLPRRWTRHCVYCVGVVPASC